ncbi:MAG TPA: ROK family protein [Candidatus Acidoferrum sp.]|nr:ROK family protein [Candidatus Acidoferrum sp.]
MTSLERTPGGSLVAGVDVGGTKVAALVVDADGATLGRAERAMTGRSGAAGIEPVLGAVRAALDAAGATDRDLSAIGVGVPGRVDPVSGVVGLATNLGWRDMPLARLVEAEFGVKCAVENDVHLAAAGLVGHDVAGGAQSLAYVAVGTGIGAGLVLDGRLHRGGRGMAGEIGHVVVEPTGVACRCGQHGCLETVASGPAVARQAAEAVAGGAESSLRDVPHIDAKAVFDAARAGDPLAGRVVAAAGEALARAIAGLVLTCDVECVLLGGGVAAAGDVFLQPILAELERLRSGSALVSELLPVGTVRLLPAHFDAVAWGGVALALRARGSARASPVGGRAGTRPVAVVEEVVAREPLT